MQTQKTKKIIKFLLAGSIGLAVLFIPLKDTHFTNTAYATLVGAPVGNVGAAGAASASVNSASTTAPAANTSQKEFADALEVILKIIYLLLWPFLALAGLALDNGMVYGSYFQLDSALFTFWNIVKNFANFALGFLFLWSILKYIFNFGSKAENPMNMITKLLIAGIGIQASWFIVGALIDVSTVATVGIGGLPLQLLNNEEAGKKPLFGLKTNLKISDMGNALTSDKGFVILYTYPTTPKEYYVPCAIQNQKLLQGDDWAATYGITATGKQLGNSDATWDEVNKDYCMFGNDVLSFTEVGSNKILPGSDELKKMLKDSQVNFRNKNNCSAAGNLCQTVSNIAQKGKGYQGAFYALYGSLLNLGSIHVSVNKSNASMTMEALIKTIIGIAYLVPLLVLCVVLIIRIAVLWVTIAFSPILVLSEVFGFNLGDMKKFGIKNLISMIFLPVMATFAISISIVFLAVLSEGMTKGNSLAAIGMGTHNEGNKSCIDLVVTTLCIDTPTQDIGVSGILDFFPWIILNIFGIGLMWTILMMTMKSTEFTGKVVNGLDSFAKNFLSNANIVPLPGGGTSVQALKNTGRNISSSIDNAASANANTVVAPALQNMIQRFDGQRGKGDKQINTATESINKGGSPKAAIEKLISPGGALYNPRNSGGVITGQGNNLDLSQYDSKATVDFINAVSKAGNLGETYDSVDKAFSDDKFLSYLKSLGLTPEQIKDIYTGREGGGLSNDQKAIITKIQALSATVPAATPASLSTDGKTYTTNDGTYTLAKDGFKKTSKDGKTSSTISTETEWEKLGITEADLKKMKQSNSGITLDQPFLAWIDKKTQPTSTNTTNNNTTTTNNNTTNTAGTGTTNGTNGTSNTTP